MAGGRGGQVLAGLIICVCFGATRATSGGWDLNERFMGKAQVMTGARLLKLGEAVHFDFYVPDGMDHGDLTVFPRYLELAEPGDAFQAEGTLDWVDALEHETVPLAFSDGWASATYRPTAAGNYLARWRAGGETFYRYFAAIEDDYVVIRWGGYPVVQRPTLHATGIPVELPLAVEPYTDPTSKEQYRQSFHPDDPLYQAFLEFHRLHGDLIAAQYPDTPGLSQDERVALYGEALERVKGLLPDQRDALTGRVEMWHGQDPGYAETFRRLGITNHFGLQMANGGSWMGMPEFPYYTSAHDLRKTNQGEGGPVVAHQWDYCSGWHFLGPVTWHSQFDNAPNHWDDTARCLTDGLEEAANLAEMSGHPAFLFPLYDAAFTSQVNGGELRDLMDDPNWGPDTPHYPSYAYVDRFQRFFAFEMPKQFHIAYARSSDVADYYRRHFPVTPRSVFVSRTDHAFYDMNWLNGWAGGHILLTRERLPWNTRISSVHNVRRLIPYGGKDPQSYEYLVVEDQQRSVRFEREAINPLWWYDYTNQQQEIDADGNSHIHWVQTPDVDFYQENRNWPYYNGVDPTRPPTFRDAPRWMADESGMTVRLRAVTEASFPDYAIALWGLPDSFARDPRPERIQTNAKEFVLAKNTEGEHHLVLMFDLKPGCVVEVTLLDD